MQMKDELNNMYNDNALLFIIVKFWAAEFKHVHTSLGDNECSGCLKTAIIDENIA